MKKMLLGASALVFGGAVLAQTPASLETVKSNPWSGSDANYGLSEQYGTENKVRVRQAGAHQEVYTFQADGSGDGSNQASVTQVSMPGTLPNRAATVQLGTENQATSVQWGGYNESAILQGTNDDSSANNKALVSQGTGSAPVYGNTSVISQDGEYNLAATSQSGTLGYSEVAQNGEANKAFVYQEGENGQIAGISQEGNYNEATAHQSGPGVNAALTLQNGDANRAYQYQESVNAGLGNAAVIVQGETFEAADNKVANKLDLGVDTKVAPKSTVSSDNHAAQLQFGNENAALTAQYGDENLSRQFQNGYGNAAAIVQDGHDNYANQHQYGNDNAAAILQLGEHNKAYQRQYGNDNLAVSYQEGDANLVNTYQEGNYLVAGTAQIGEGNQVLLVQKGANGQAYGVLQVGSNNSADIMQLDGSSCGDFDANKVECEFPDIKVPTCPIPVDDLDLKDPCPEC